MTQEGMFRTCPRSLGKSRFGASQASAKESSAQWEGLAPGVQRLYPMDVAFTCLPVCRFYSLRDHFCTLDSSLFLTVPACISRFWARLVAISRNFCLTEGRNGFNC